MNKINSLQNPKIKRAVKLRDSGQRKKQKLFLIEGFRELSLAIEAGVIIETVFYCFDFIREEKKIKKIIQDKIVEVNQAVFKKISYRENPDGFLAVAKIKDAKLSDVKLGDNPLIVVLEAVEKPGNLGAVLRTADAVGSDVVIINDPKTDIYNPNVIRASQGTVFTGQIVTCSVEETIQWLKKKKIKSFATTLTAQKLYTEGNFNIPSAIVMGTEDKGLSKEWLKKADEKIKIPMRGRADSLNVSVSAAVILFEALRQRL